MIGARHEEIITVQEIIKGNSLIDFFEKSGSVYYDRKAVIFRNHQSCLFCLLYQEMHLLDRNTPFHLFGEIDLFDKNIIRKNGRFI